jgi:hypothetical protein
MKLDDIIKDKNSLGAIVISITLGLGLASLFKKVCKKNCIIFKVHNNKQIKSKIFKDDDKNKCYQFDKVKASCRSKKEIIKEEQQGQNNE